MQTLFEHSEASESTLEQIKLVAMLNAVTRTGNKRAAADALGVSLRTIYHHCHAYVGWVRDIGGAKKGPWSPVCTHDDRAECAKLLRTHESKLKNSASVILPLGEHPKAGAARALFRSRR